MNIGTHKTAPVTLGTPEFKGTGTNTPEPMKYALKGSVDVYGDVRGTFPVGSSVWIQDSDGNLSSGLVWRRLYLHYMGVTRLYFRGLELI